MVVTYNGAGHVAKMDGKGHKGLAGLQGLLQDASSCYTRKLLLLQEAFPEDRGEGAERYGKVSYMDTII